MFEVTVTNPSRQGDIFSQEVQQILELTIVILNTHLGTFVVQDSKQDGIKKDAHQYQTPRLTGPRQGKSIRSNMTFLQ